MIGFCAPPLPPTHTLLDFDSLQYLILRQLIITSLTQSYSCIVNPCVLFSQTLSLLYKQSPEVAIPTVLPAKKVVRKKERLSRYAPVDSSRLAVREKPAQKSHTEQKPRERQRGKQQRNEMASDEGNSSDDETESESAQHAKPFVSNHKSKSPSMEHI